MISPQLLVMWVLGSIPAALLVGAAIQYGRPRPAPCQTSLDARREMVSASASK